MKKLLSLFLAILLCMTLFTSCKTKFEPQSAKDLWDKINDTMDTLNAYEASGTAALSFNASGVQMSMNSTMKTLVSGLQRGEYYYYSSADSTLRTATDEPSYDSSEEVMHETRLEAFFDGKMFVSLESDERQQKLYSPITKDEYIAYLDEKEVNTDDIEFNDCTNASFSQNEDGTWSLQYSGYTKKAIDQIMKAFDMDDAAFDFEVADVEVSMIADSEFRAKELNIKFVFDEDTATKTSPSFEIFTKYFNYNAITPIHPDSTEYTRIDDCRTLYKLEDMLEALAEKQNGSFTLALEQTISVPSLNHSQTYTEFDTVTYGEKNGSYFYDIIASTNTSTINISYANGKQTIELSDQNQTVNQTVAEAKDYIISLINSATYSPDYVSLITDHGNGVYTVQCKYPYTAPYDSIFEIYSGQLTEITQTITFTVENESIVKIENHTLAIGTASTGYQSVELRIELTSTNIFEK